MADERETPAAAQRRFVVENAEISKRLLAAGQRDIAIEYMTTAIRHWEAAELMDRVEATGEAPDDGAAFFLIDPDGGATRLAADSFADAVTEMIVQIERHGKRQH